MNNLYFRPQLLYTKSHTVRCCHGVDSRTFGIFSEPITLLASSTHSFQTKINWGFHHKHDTQSIFIYSKIELNLHDDDDDDAPFHYRLIAFPLLQLKHHFEQVYTWARNCGFMVTRHDSVIKFLRIYAIQQKLKSESGERRMYRVNFVHQIFSVAKIVFYKVEVFTAHGLSAAHEWLK